MRPRLREFIKVICVVVLAVAVIVAAIAWAERPTPDVWLRRVIFSALATAAFVVFLAIHFKVIFYRPDLAPDFLRQYVGSYFDRDGFCFTVTMTAENRLCILWILFQNQNENPCYARVAIRPTGGFFGGRKLDSMTFDVHADCGAFGVARAEIPMPLSYQGRLQRFDIGASADYPSGKGRALRFGDATPLRTNEQFANSGQTTITVLMFAGGWLVFHRPASVKLFIPRGVSPEGPAQPRFDVETLWRIGDSGLPNSTPADVNRRLAEIMSGAVRPGSAL
jgi:hypothetical protein